MVVKKRGRPKKIIEFPIKALLEANKTRYESRGTSVLEALTNLPLTYSGVKTKGVITISEGESKVERLFYLKPLRLLFASKLRRVGFAKQLNSLLKAKVAKSNATN